MADISRAMDKQMQFLIYNTPEEQVSVDVIVKDETIWVTQRTMAELFGCSSDNISLHLKNIYASNELQENSTTEEFSVVRKEVSRNIKGKVSRQQALEKAYAEYDAFNKTQKITSDFDLLLKATEKVGK